MNQQNEYQGYPLLTRLNTGAQNTNHWFDRNGIGSAARKACETMERWNYVEAPVGYPMVHTVVGEMKSHFSDFTQAITSSDRTAQDGYEFSAAAVEICRKIRRIDPRRQSSIDSFCQSVSQLRHIATRAKHAATQAQNGFRQVRRGMYNTIRQIPQVVGHVTGSSMGLPQDIAFQLPTVSHKQSRLNLRDSGRSSSSYNVATRQPLGAAIQQLRQAEQDLQQLVDCVSTFAHWWTEMEANLIAIENKPLSTQDILALQESVILESVKSGWKEAMQRYLSYKAQLRDNFDYYQLPQQSDSAHPLIAPQHIMNGYQPAGGYFPNVSNETFTQSIAPERTPKKGFIATLKGIFSS